MNKICVNNKSELLAKIDAFIIDEDMAESEYGDFGIEVMQAVEQHQTSLVSNDSLIMLSKDEGKHSDFLKSLRKIISDLPECK